MLTTETFIEKARKVHGDKYNYSLVEYKGSLGKVKIICPIHGEFEQIVCDHLKGRGCKKCGRTLRIKSRLQIFDTTSFIERARKIHGNKYDYSLVDYKKSIEKVKIICPTHGEFEQTPNSHVCGCGCKKCCRLGFDIIFIEKARKIHGDRYNYSLVDYKGSLGKVKIICPIHGEFEQAPVWHLSGGKCQKCAIDMRNKAILKSKIDQRWLSSFRMLNLVKYNLSKMS